MKRTILLVVSIGGLLISLAVVRAQADCPLLGDVSGNGILDCTDVGQILEMSVEKRPVNMCGDISGNGVVSPHDASLVMSDPNYQGASGDVNFDGVINCLDIMQILEASVGLTEAQNACGDLSGNDVVSPHDAALLLDKYPSLSACQWSIPSPCPSFGDINGNGLIDSEDSRLIMEYSVGNIQLSVDQIERADVSANGAITPFDAALLLEYLAGIIDTLPICNITKTTCDAKNPCPEGLTCYSFPNIGLRCAQPDPFDYYLCPDLGKPSIAEIYPGIVMCEPFIKSTPEDAEDIVSFNVETHTVTITRHNEIVSSEVKIKSTAPNTGVLEAGGIQATYSGELSISGEKLILENSQINYLPEYAVSVSDTPVISSVQEVNLKQQDNKPVYSVKGVKSSRLFFFIPKKMTVETNVDAATGKVEKVDKPWWAFLADE